MMIDSKKKTIKGFYWAVLPVLFSALILFFCSGISLLSGVRDYLYSSDVGGMFIMAGIVAEYLRIAGIANATGVSIISYAMITQLLLMLIIALSACIVLLGAIKGKRRIFFSYLMVIIGFFSASSGPLSGKAFLDFMIIISWIMALSSIMYLVPMRIENISRKKANKIIKKRSSLNTDCPRNRFFALKIIVLVVLAIVFVINTLICLKYVSGGIEAVLDYWEYNVELRTKNEISGMKITGMGYVQTAFADMILARTGTYGDFYLSTAKMSLVSLVIGLLTVFIVLMMEIFIRNRKLWFTCPIVFIVVFINIDVLFLKKGIPDFLFLILNLTSILMAFCYARIERAIQTRECLMLLEQEKTVNVYSSEGN